MVSDRMGEAPDGAEAELILEAPPAMPLPDPFRTGAGVQQGELFGSWDALSPSTRRGQLPWVTLDTRREVTTWQRSELLRAVRWLRNVGMIKGLINNASNLIGWMRPQAQSADKEWNRLANENFNAKAGSAQVFDAAGKFNFFSAQLMLNRAALGDGDCLTVLTSSPSGGPRVAFYEAHQVMSPKDAGEAWSDGVKKGALGRHIAYGVRSGDGDSGDSVVIPARDAIFYGFYERPGHNRPLPPLTHAITTAVDIVEMRGDLKHGIKINNLAAAYRLKDGESGPRSGAGGLPGATKEYLAKTGGKNAAGTADQKQSLVDAYSGGMMPELAPGEKIQLITDGRPHSNQRDFINDDLIRDIAIGFELMPETVWKVAELNGPEMRYVLSLLSRWIRVRQGNLVDWGHRYWVYHVAKEIKRGELPAPTDEKWMSRSRVKWTRQSDLTIDRGRDGKERRESLRDGIGTEEDFYEEMGAGGYEEVMRKRHDEIMYKKDLAAQGDYPVEWLMPCQKGGQMTVQPDDDD